MTLTIHLIAGRYRVCVDCMAIGDHYRTYGGARIYKRALETGRAKIC